MMKRYICLDIGGTFLKYGILTSGGRFLVKGKVPTHAEQGGPAVLAQAKELIVEYSEKNALDGICISTTGMVDPETGTIVYASDAVPEYAGISLKTELESAFGIPCEVENDVNCAGLAESISGVGKDSRMNVCLTVGTGIGGCLIVDKKVFHGFSNSACEVGYLRLPQGEFQREASATALCERVSKRKQGRKPIGERWDGVRIFQAAQDGDRICTEEIDRLIDILALGIANICYVANPKTVILGGGIMEQELYIQPRLEKALMKYLIPQVWKNTKICMAEYKNDAGMLGAFYHFRAMQKKRK